MEEKELYKGTLGFLVKEGKVWLAIKSRKIGKDYWNGYGGGLEPGDANLEASLVREVLEEGKVIISKDGLEKMAIINFHNTKSDGKKFIAEIHIYLIKNWEGKPQETEEMKNPTKFEVSNLPLEKMMPADKEWLPLILEGKKIIAEYHYGPFQKELIKEGSIRFVDRFPDEPLKEFKMH